jgi:hypothetical protein
MVLKYVTHLLSCFVGSDIEKIVSFYLLMFFYGLTNILDFSENKSLPRHVGDLS